MFSINTSTYNDQTTIDTKKFPKINDSQNKIILPSIPKYTDHHIQDMIKYDENKYSHTYGLTYLYNNRLKLKERNEHLYKIRSELNSDQLTVASHSNLSTKRDDISSSTFHSSASSASSDSSSYYKGFPDYVETTANFPILYQEVHESIEDNLYNKSMSGNTSHHSAFDFSRDIGYQTNSVSNSQVGNISHNNNNSRRSNHSNSDYSTLQGNNNSNNKIKVKSKDKITHFQFNNDDDSSKSSKFTYSKYIYDEDEFDNGLSYYDKEGKNENNLDDDNESKLSYDSNGSSKTNKKYNDDDNYLHDQNMNQNKSNSIIKINADINKNKILANNESTNNHDIGNGSKENYDESININDYTIITKPAAHPPGNYQFALRLRPFEITQHKLHIHGMNLIKCNHVLQRRDIKLRQERYDKEYEDLQSRLSEEEEDSRKRVQYTKTV